MKAQQQSNFRTHSSNCCTHIRHSDITNGTVEIARPPAPVKLANCSSTCRTMGAIEASQQGKHIGLQNLTISCTTDSKNSQQNRKQNPPENLATNRVHKRELNRNNSRHYRIPQPNPQIQPEIGRRNCPPKQTYLGPSARRSEKPNPMKPDGAISNYLTHKRVQV